MLNHLKSLITTIKAVFVPPETHTLNTLNEKKHAYLQHIDSISITLQSKPLPHSEKHLLQTLLHNNYLQVEKIDKEIAEIMSIQAKKEKANTVGMPYYSDNAYNYATKYNIYKKNT